MHFDPANSVFPAKVNLPSWVPGALDFLWLELTNRCNLRCVHCYTESDPHSGSRDLLSTTDYESILHQAYALGCRKVQFIGGEPQLHSDFLRLVMAAKTIGFEFIEVFSNLTRLHDETISYAAGHGVCFATSVYSDRPSAHDAITGVRSSHSRTIGNLKKLLAHGIETRAAIIHVDQDDTEVERTRAFLQRLGVRHVRSSGVREFGRGEAVVGQTACLSGLCGHCWAGKLCVAPDGAAYPCVMARQWPVGNLLEMPLGAVVQGQPLAAMREDIFHSVWLPKLAVANKKPPKKPTPKKAPAEDAETQDECPQTCGPDLSTCGPIGSCPQTPCTPIATCEPIEKQ
jgi:MoaA/NifB/PqqE/SkfB family radical SAM enzyme